MDYGIRRIKLVKWLKMGLDLNTNMLLVFRVSGFGFRV